MTQKSHGGVHPSKIGEALSGTRRSSHAALTSAGSAGWGGRAAAEDRGPIDLKKNISTCAMGRRKA